MSQPRARLPPRTGTGRGARARRRGGLRGLRRDRYPHPHPGRGDARAHRGSALEKTGLVTIIVGALAPSLAGLPPIVAPAAVYLVGSALTEIVTNNAGAVVLAPVAIALAGQFGVDPRPFVAAVMFAASASFAAPIGYQTDTLVHAAGGHRFADFLRVGLPPNLLVGLLSVPRIPLVRPF